MATVTRPSASSIWRSWAAPTGSSASLMPTAISPPAASVPVRVAASAATHASGPTVAVSGESAPKTVMLSAPTSANWARLNAVRIGMWRRSAAARRPGPTIAASISSDGWARKSPATSGTSASDSDSALWRKLMWTTKISAASERGQRPPRQVDAAHGRLQVADDQHKEDRRHCSHGGDQCPHWTVRAEARDQPRHPHPPPASGVTT